MASRWFQVSNWTAAALFGFSAAVQVNDPDPGRWLAIYLSAAAVAATAAARGSVPWLAPLTVAAISLVWGIVLAAGGPGLDLYPSMFDAWEMKSAPIEEAREASGLFIVATWMVFLAAHAWTSRRSGGPLHSTEDRLQK
jgi:hypothetical protein